MSDTTPEPEPIPEPVITNDVGTKRMADNNQVVVESEQTDLTPTPVTEETPVTKEATVTPVLENPTVTPEETKVTLEEPTIPQVPIADHEKPLMELLWENKLLRSDMEKLRIKNKELSLGLKELRQEFRELKERLDSVAFTIME